MVARVDIVDDDDGRSVRSGYAHERRRYGRQIVIGGLWFRICEGCPRRDRGDVGRNIAVVVMRDTG